MNRRNALKIAAGTLAAGGAGVLTLASAFKPEAPSAELPKKLDLDREETSWKYSPLDPATTAQLAYMEYPNGSCMYGVFGSIVSQLAEKIGEPYASFPIHMMKYGHGGIGGAGTICGTLNGAAALMGLLVSNKGTRDALTAELFSWYERSAFPSYIPAASNMDITLPSSVSESVLCHASNTKWAMKSGYRIDSKERKERCRRMTADVAARTVVLLNSYFENTLLTGGQDNETVTSCISCHGSQGKVANTASKMNCSSCHEKSLGHKVFGDIHYKLMDAR